MKGATGPIEVRLHDIDKSDMKEIVKHTRRYVDDEKPTKVIEVTDTPTKTSKFLEILSSSNKGFLYKFLGSEVPSANKKVSTILKIRPLSLEVISANDLNDCPLSAWLSCAEKSPTHLKNLSTGQKIQPTQTILEE